MSQAAEPAKLVLACQGHTHYLGADSQALPVSLGIIVNLADRTVQGFRYPEDFPIEITNINETTIVFHGFPPRSRRNLPANQRRHRQGDRGCGGDLGCDELEEEQSIGDTLAEMQAYATDVLRTVVS
jgi:hypothetical protein